MPQKLSRQIFVARYNHLLWVFCSWLLNKTWCPSQPLSKFEDRRSSLVCAIQAQSIFTVSLLWRRRKRRSRCLSASLIHSTEHTCIRNSSLMTSCKVDLTEIVALTIRIDVEEIFKFCPFSVERSWQAFSH